MQIIWFFPLLIFQTSEDWICEQKRPSRFVDSYDDKLEKYIRHR